MRQPRYICGSSGTFAFLLCVGCGFVGLDISETNDSVTLGDGDGDGDVGDGDTGDGDNGDGDTGDGDAMGGDGSGGGDGDGDASGGADPGSGGGANTGGDANTGGNPGTGGLNGTGGLDGSGGLSGIGGGIIAVWDPLLFHPYEDGQLPGEPKSTGSAGLEVQTTIAYESTHALFGAVPEEQLAATFMTFPLSDKGLSKVYLRAWLYVPHALTGDITLFRFTGENGDDSLDYGLSKENRVRVRASDGATSYFSGTEKYPTGEWFCFRADASVSDDGGSVIVGVDGSTVLTTPSDDTRPGEGITTFTYGIVELGVEQSGAAIYFDNVTVDDAPIDCDQMPFEIIDPVPLPPETL